MRIKKEFLNEKSLKPYGFKKEILYNNPDICEYEREDKYATTLIQRCDGDISIVMPNDDYCDCTNIPDVVYYLIKDGLVEAEEFKKRDIYSIDELDEQACVKATNNIFNTLIQRAGKEYGEKNCDMFTLAKHMGFKFDKNGNIKE